MYDPSSASPSPAPAPPSQWAQSTLYHPGSIVWYAGTFWRCESGHTSGPGRGGAPNNTLHLWTPVSSNGYLPNQYQLPQQQQKTTEILSPQPRYMPSAKDKSKLEKLHQDTDSNSSGETLHAGGGGGAGVGASGMEFFQARAGESMRLHLMKEEGEKSRNKEELEQELLGKRVWRVGGIGIWAYSPNEADERGKREVWRAWGKSHGKEEWLAAARARTNHYNEDSRSTKPLVQWKLVESGGVPPDALAIGHESDGQLLYAVRAWFNGGIHLGKAATRTKHNASLSWGGVEHLIDTYEVLCGAPDPTLLKWMTFRHGEKCDVHGWMPVEGGREKAGEALLIAKGSYENGQHPGKCLINDDHACVGWGGGEVWVRPFEVLAYSSAERR